MSGTPPANDAAAWDALVLALINDSKLDKTTKDAAGTLKLKLGKLKDAKKIKP